MILQSFDKLCVLSAFEPSNNFKWEGKMVWIRSILINPRWKDLKFSFLRRPQNLKQSSTWFEVYLVNVKSSGRLFQIFVVFSECLNFNNGIYSVYRQSRTFTLHLFSFCSVLFGSDQAGKWQSLFIIFQPKRAPIPNQTNNKFTDNV